MVQHLLHVCRNKTLPNSEGRAPRLACMRLKPLYPYQLDHMLAKKNVSWELNAKFGMLWTVSPHLHWPSKSLKSGWQNENLLLGQINPCPSALSEKEEVKRESILIILYEVYSEWNINYLLCEVGAVDFNHPYSDRFPQPPVRGRLNDYIHKCVSKKNQINFQVQGKVQVLNSIFL